MYIINKLFDNNPRITDIINRYTDIAKIKHISTNTIVQSLRSDKKVKNGIITFVQVSTPGVTTFEPTPIDEKLERKVYEMFVD